MLELKNVSKSFGDNTVLDGVDLQVREGETTVILGPSGSGKSTLLRVMDLLEVPESGSLRINEDGAEFGSTLSDSRIRSIRKHSAMVFQGYNLFPNQSVLKNVSLPPVLNGKLSATEAESRAKELLGKVGLGDRLNEYPDNLSGGQQQRVAIARVLAIAPDYLLFDEPTSALDPELEAEVIKVLVDLAEEKRSLVVVTHNIQFAKKVADRVLFLDDGSIGFDGSPDEFFASSNERIRRYLTTFEVA